MKFKVLALGSGIVVLLAFAAFAVNRWIDGSGATGEVGDVLMQGVDSAAIRKIEIASAKHVTTLTSEDGVRWTVVEQQNFPVDVRKVKDLLVKLTSQKLAHRVTDDPAKLGALGLLTAEENGGKLEDGKTGKLLTVFGAEGAPAYRLLIGNDRRSQGGMSFGGSYVRLPRTSVAYLISESVLIDVRPQDWIANEVLDEDADKVLKSILVERAGQPPIRLTREKPGAEWVLAGLPADQLDRDEVKRIAGQLAGLDTFYIASKDDPSAKLGRGKTGRVDFEFFDKRRFRMDVGEARAEDDFRYLTIRSELDPAVTDAELRARVDAFNARFGGRILAVYDWDGERMLPDMTDLRKKPGASQ